MKTLIQKALNESPRGGDLTKTNAYQSAMRKKMKAKYLPWMKDNGYDIDDPRDFQLICGMIWAIEND